MLTRRATVPVLIPALIGVFGTNETTVINHYNRHTVQSRYKVYNRHNPITVLFVTIVTNEPEDIILTIVTMAPLGTSHTSPIIALHDIIDTTGKTKLIRHNRHNRYSRSGIVVTATIRTARIGPTSGPGR
jgi:hypothetical protein